MCGRSTTHAPASPLFKDLGKQTLHALRLHPTTVSGDSFLQTLPEFVSQAIFVRYNNGTRTCLYFTFCKSSTHLRFIDLLLFKFQLNVFVNICRKMLLCNLVFSF